MSAGNRSDPVPPLDRRRQSRRVSRADCEAPACPQLVAAGEAALVSLETWLARQPTNA